MLDQSGWTAMTWSHL